jgi:hypothetical protein
MVAKRCHNSHRSGRCGFIGWFIRPGADELAGEIGDGGSLAGVGAHVLRFVALGRLINLLDTS